MYIFIFNICTVYRPHFSEHSKVEKHNKCFNKKLTAKFPHIIDSVKRSFGAEETSFGGH